MKQMWKPVEGTKGYLLVLQDNNMPAIHWVSILAVDVR